MPRPVKRRVQNRFARRIAKALTRLVKPGQEFKSVEAIIIQCATSPLIFLELRHSTLPQPWYAWVSRERSCSEHAAILHRLNRELELVRAARPDIQIEPDKTAVFLGRSLYAVKSGRSRQWSTRKARRLTSEILDRIWREQDRH